MAKIKFSVLSTILHDGKPLMPGSTVSFDDQDDRETIELLREAGAIGPAQEADAPATDPAPSAKKPAA